MNLIFALEQLGYLNIDDFEIDFNGTEFVISKWQHANPQPTLLELEQAWNDWQVANPVDLTLRRLEAKVEVDRVAERARLKYVTFGSGQAMTYAEKSDEAADYVAAGYPVDLSSYPFLQAEVNATGKTPVAAADDILMQKSAWIVVGAAIEEARLLGKKNIDAAGTENEITLARDNAVAALEAL